MASSQQRLTLIFEAETTRALNQLNTLSTALDKITGKGQNNRGNSGVDSLFDVAIAQSQRLERQIDQINRSVSRLSNNNLNSALTNWNRQANTLESSFAKSAQTVSRIGDQARKSFGEIPKSLEVKLNAIAGFTGEKKPSESLEDRRKRRAKEFEENQGIRQEFEERKLRRKVTREDQEIRQNLANEQVREQIRREQVKASRVRQAESIIQGLNKPQRTKPTEDKAAQAESIIEGLSKPTSRTRKAKTTSEPITEPEEKPATKKRTKKATETTLTDPNAPIPLKFPVTFLGTYQPPTRQILTRRQVEEQEQLREQRTARRARNESVFSSQRFGSKLSNEATTELNNAGSEQINQRLQAILERNRAKEAEQKRLSDEKQAEIVRLRAEIKQRQADNEQRRIQQNRDIRERSQRVEANRFQMQESNRGVGFGGSNFGRIAQQRQAERASVPTAGRQIAALALQSAEPLLGNTFQQISQGTQQLGSGLSSAFGIGQLAATGLASVISLGIVGALTLAVGLVGKLNEGFNDAKKDQLALLGISSETQRLFNVDQKTADDFYQNLQRRSEIAGRDTSVETSNITDLNTRGFSSFLTTFKDSGKSLDEVAEKMVDINTRFAILAQATPGVTNFQVQNAYTSAVTGDLGKALSRQEFFRNSGFAEVVKEVAKNRGVDLNRADRTQQVEILEEALKLRVPTDLIERAQNDSIEAQQSSFMDKLFSQRIGYFGIQRDTDLDTEGTQSVFSELTRSFKLVLGKGGILDQLGQTFGFIDFDLMDGLRRGIQGLNDFLEILIKLLDKFNNLNQTISSIKVPGTDLQIGEATNTFLSNAFIPNGVLAGNIAGGIKNTVQATGNVFSQGFDFVKGLFGFGNSFTGNIPDSSNNYSNQSIFDAIAIEKANAPKGSNLLIANDSEYIFKNEHQLTEFFKTNYQQPSNNSSPNTTQKGGKENKVYFNSGAIQINTTSNDPKAIAQQVIHEINNLLNFELGATI